VAAEHGELVAVDNGSHDGSAKYVAASFPGARVIRNDRNRGYALASMQGARAARGEWLAFVNPDVRVDPGSLAALRRALEEMPEAGLACARLRYPDGGFQPSCRRFPARANLAASRGSVLSVWGSARAHYTIPDAGHTVRVPAVACAYALIRRERFLAVGGFDERFFVFMEDTDLSLRLDRAGHPNVFVPAAGAVHDWGRSSRAGAFRRAFYHHRSMWQYFRKHEPGGFSSLVLPLLLTGNLCARALFPRPQR